MNDFTRRKLLTSMPPFGAAALTGGFVASGALAQPIYNPNVTQLTQYSKGELPILLVAPHGGTELVYGIASRRNVNRPVANFSYFGAVWTREICLQISRTLKRLSGGRTPYMVLNLAHRRYVDVNREESDAYEVILNAPRIYWEYHDFITEYVNRMNVLYDNPLLIEITGQQELPDYIVRRTLNGKSVERMVKSYGEKVYNQKLNKFTEAYERSKIHDPKRTKFLARMIEQFKQQKPQEVLGYGHEIYTGDNSLIAEIKKRGYRINPALYETDTEQALTTAGDYTLQRYGARDLGNINAIQLVVGSNYRRTSNYLQTGSDIGSALWEFAQKFIL